MKTYFCTYAANATPIHKGLWPCIQSFLKAENAELKVVGGRYRNPTSIWSNKQETDEWWAEEVTPFLVKKEIKLGPKLKLFGDVSIQCTAENPLSGMESALGTCSAIFGHPRRHLDCVPSGGLIPRIMFTTSACTVPNYTPTKAGKKGRMHHVIGGLIVQVLPNGKYYCRHVTYDEKTKSFTDLDKRYTATGVQKAPRALGVVLGDLHSGTVEQDVWDATVGLLKAVKPQKLVLHDVLNFYARNHHDKGPNIKYAKLHLKVEDEVIQAAEDVEDCAEYADKIYIVRSNHDEAFERWLAETDPDSDLTNAHYYHKMKDRSFEFFKKNGKWPNLFEIECRRLGVSKKVKFLRRKEEFKIAGINCAFHGDKGLNGARPSKNTYRKLGEKCIIGHGHSIFELDGAFGVGVTGSLNQGYNNPPGTWLNGHCVINADGKRQSVIVIGGKFRGES